MSGMINKVKVKILFDLGATYSFISPVALEKYGFAAYEHNDFKQVEMAYGIKQVVGPSVDQCQVNLRVCITKLKAYVTALGTYDVIIGMDWQEVHRALVDCFKKKVICLDDEGCKLYVVEAVSDQKGPSLDQHPILSKFKDVFPKELPGLPPVREIDFTIDLKPGVERISKTPYRMTTPKLCEL
eukprot:PITA_27890